MRTLVIFFPHALLHSRGALLHLREVVHVNIACQGFYELEAQLLELAYPVVLTVLEVEFLIVGYPTLNLARSQLE